jgi:hypothetical protein
MLAVASLCTTASSINLRRLTPLLPIAIDRPNQSSHPLLPKQAV